MKFNKNELCTLTDEFLDLLETADDLDSIRKLRGTMVKINSIIEGAESHLEYKELEERMEIDI